MALIEIREGETTIQIQQDLKQIKKMLQLLLQQTGREIMTLDELTNQVKANTDAEDGAATLLKQLADLIKASAQDPAKVQALADQLKQHADALSAAIVENTPSEGGGGSSGPT
jgi:hypothetical protein